MPAEVAHDVAGVLEGLDLGNHVPVSFFLGRPEGVGLRHGKADEGQAGPVLCAGCQFGFSVMLLVSKDLLGCRGCCSSRPSVVL